MSIKGCRFLWIKLGIENRRFLGIPFPIPLFVFQELLDCFQEILTAACFFVPQVPDPGSSSRITIHSVKALVILTKKLLDSFAGDEPYQLVDVTTDKVKVSVIIR
ncbi:hypothetical protein [Lacrimispora saccharolytica]|uniref:Uncharacterized protein n=1 Tax=Lacrimispora saccharolytica (strain ATCC 35040 / DSM 2544 / NRCC 2533 / WM1) TaxID=610130 RepID=D9R5P0_LACSW|nr:hypothetical protein [Lacrimispora saccharolytica]ADL05223.1 hypothetical protein Closa_2664 [[Clostridium] saccharolyticum WM1]QRV20600.1 hypothetical protein I6K70_03445 [Lacrimispora saccharolytica]